MAEGLTRLGIKNDVREDGIAIVGGQITGGEVDTFHDHRIAMSFSVAALRASGPIHVNDCDHVATSFPGFAALARGVGLSISEAD
jgi:3-phosphoshikimate 1-carboxyvinyltransferase